MATAQLFVNEGAYVFRRAASEGAQCADEIVHAIFSFMDEFSRGRQTDDATVVVLRAIGDWTRHAQRLLHSPMPGIGVNFDASSDGKRLLAHDAEEGAQGPRQLIANWPVKRRK